MNQHYLAFLLLSLAIGIHCCSNECSSCNETTCLQCWTGFYLNANTCQKCSVGCMICSSKSNCSFCDHHFYLSQSINTTICTPCGRPAESCLNCTASGCKKARESAYLKNDFAYLCPKECSNCLNDTFCTICSEDYYQLGHTCSKCIQGCSFCTNYFNCSKCTDSYYLLNYTCHKCSSDCLKCSNLSTCTKCKTGFFLLDGSCQNTIEIILIVFVIILFQPIIFLPLTVPAAFYLAICKIIQIYKKRHFQRVPDEDKVYSEREIIANDVCSICLASQGFCMISCGHVFHATCIYQWLKEHSDCPMCRKSVYVQIGVKCKACRKQGLKGTIKHVEALRELAALKNFCCGHCNALLENI